MKKSILTALFIIMGSTLMADEIYLSNGDVLRGTIIEFWVVRVEYVPD